MGWMKILVVAVFMSFLPLIAAGSGTVLLTIDVEQEEDPENLSALNIEVPATYFFLGEFAKTNFELVRAYSGSNTIGAHGYSHESMDEMPAAVVEAELLLTRIMLTEASGRPVTWFRAPFLKSSEVVREKIAELGYLYDSTEIENWAEEEKLFSLPISMSAQKELLVSDYDIFEKAGMDAAQALRFLKNEYVARERLNRPLVILLHPSIIAKHQSVLDDFVAFVQQKEGRFLTADQWMEQRPTPSVNRVGVWMDLSIGFPALERLSENLSRIGATDVFLMARDHDGYSYMRRDELSGTPSAFEEIVEALQHSGVRIHAWLPVLLNPAYAQLYPDRAMTRWDDERSLLWLSPDDPEIRAYINETVDELLRRFPIDGIHLDYIRYPDLEHDFSKSLFQRFAEKYPDREVDHALLRSDLYTEWTRDRRNSIAKVVEGVKTIVERHETNGRTIELSAALIAEGALSAKARYKFGQDYARLANSLDLVIPMAYFKSEKRPPEWIRRVIFSTRYLVGDTPVLTGLLGYQQPEHWRLTDRELARSIEFGSKLTQGVVFYNYLNLFGEGKDASWDMPRSSVAAISEQLLHSKQSSLDRKTGTAQPPSEAGHRNAATADGAGQIRQYRVEHGVLLVILLMALGYLIYRIKKNGIHQRDLSSSTIREEPIDTSPDRLRQLDALIVGSRNIGVDLSLEVSRLLNALGSKTINHLRQVQMLDFVRQGRGTVGELMEVLSTQSRAAETLRRIEELTLLDYTHLSNEGTVGITPSGERVLEQALKEGYSGELVNFIDRRLCEEIVLTCPHCGARSSGQWFWVDFECSGCHKKSRVSAAPNIYVRSKTRHLVENTPGLQASQNLNELA